MTFTTLDHPIRWLFFSHAFAGALALLVLTIPLVSKKGGKLHVQAGTVYFLSMLYVGLSSFVITPWRIFFDPNRTTESANFSLFLSYVSVFTLSAIWFGLMSLKAKLRRGPSRSPLFIGFPIVTLIAGLFIQVIGLKFQNNLLIVFPFLGHVASIQQMRYWMRALVERKHWWYAHMNGMFVACIATITAFLVTAAPRIWPGPITSSIWLWILPGAILGTLSNRWTASFKKQFEK